MTELQKKLALKNEEAVPGSIKPVYGTLVTKEVRKEYSQDQVEAIINNYLADPNDETYVKEFKALQEYRKLCKAKARAELGITEEGAV